MRSKMTWVVVATAALSAGIACSDEDPNTPSTQGLPNQPGTAGTGGTPGMMMPNGQPNPQPEQPPVQPPQMMGGMQSGAANNGGSGGGAGGAPPVVADAGTTPNAPDAGGDDDPPPNMGTVDFSQVFPLLVTSCGGCHGANAPGARPRFAQMGNEAASFTATQAMSPQGGTVAGRIIARAVTLRNMPPACGGQALGTGQCLDVAEAALLQDWVDDGALP